MASLLVLALLVELGDLGREAAHRVRVREVDDVLVDREKAEVLHPREDADVARQHAAEPPQVRVPVGSE